MKVLVIPEDFRNDQYILKPIIDALFKKLGRRATVRVCHDPLLGSVSQALRRDRIEEILDRYRGMIDLFLLCVDRDGDEHRQARLRNIENQAKDLLQGRGFLAEHAWQELEVWLLAGHDLPAQWVWNEVRQEIDPKERYYLPFAQGKKRMDEPAGGRISLGAEAAQRYPRIRQLCPEVADLEDRIARWLRSES